MSRTAARLTILLVGTGILAVNPAVADTSDKAIDESRLPPMLKRQIDFVEEVQPLLREACYGCHGAKQQEGGLRLDWKRRAFAGGDNGPVILPGDAAASRLVHRVSGLDDESGRMPPEGEADPLSRDQVAVLRTWIDQGAGWPRDADGPIVRRGGDHWAYQPLTMSAVGEIRSALTHHSWVDSPIDLFIAARLESAGIKASPEADGPTRIKRLSYDLLGIPPDPYTVDAFVDDVSPDAYMRRVDRLLASPRFGERWGRHWLDKARYADSDGYEKDEARPNAWRYRDWVIDAINRDLPYDQFSIQQLAGDLSPEATPQQRLATAFHRQTLTNNEGGVDQEEYRVRAVMDRVNTTSTVWLGLTVGCAQCHSHKYDAITQREYYELFAFFDNGDEVNAKVPSSQNPLIAAGNEMEVRVIGERQERRTTRLLRRGDFLQPQFEVRSAGLEVLPPLAVQHHDAPANRLDLARWLTGPDNPLAPRVAVNHIWAHLFGRGLVRSMDDFGVRGQPPTHPQLLDYLAAEYRRCGWSRKQMIRSIVNSAAYRQASRHRPELVDTDPANDLFYRQNRFRVDAEVVRDLNLAAAGLLSDKIGGPSVYPPLPKGIADLSFGSGFKWKTSGGEDRYRRGMYTFFKRTTPHPNLLTFDCPDAITTTVQRRTSNTPLSALATLNNEVFFEAARGLAERVLVAELKDDDARMTFAFRVCVARRPTGSQHQRLMALLDKSRAWYRDHPSDADLLNGGEILRCVAASEFAAWTATIRVITNMDEFITRE